MRQLPILAFFLSGASSLMFQTLWTRMLSHVFGSTSVAISTGLTAFMGGLGLGAWLLSRHAHRVRRPLLLYGAAELLVAAWALALPGWVDPEGWLAGLNATLHAGLEPTSLGMAMARFACVLPILLVPTTLMGATLPLLALHESSRFESPGEASASVGKLYAVNTFGAVCGTLGSGFLLMPALGAATTNQIAAGINVVLCLAMCAQHAWAASGPRAESAPGVPGARRLEHAPDGPTRGPAAQPMDRLTRRVALVSYGISGACALTYEVVWSRALSMAIGSSVYSFALILATFLLGIASGSAWQSRLFSTRRFVPSRSESSEPRSRVQALCHRIALPAGMLCLPAHASLGLRHGWLPWVLVSLASFAACVFLGWLGAGRLRSAQQIAPADGEDLWQAEELTDRRWVLNVLAVPTVGAACHVLVAFAETSKHSQVVRHGHLPYICFTVVASIALWLLLGVLWRHRLVMLAALQQMYIAAATFAGYLWQDDIPHAFARMVSGLGDLSDQVGVVQWMMAGTAALCTLPATLGMGAMFPISLRIWTTRGSDVAHEVGTLYTSNTLGSICGAWLPGFVLMPLIGMETTLQLGILLNVVIALALVLRVRGGNARERFIARTLALATPPVCAGLWLLTCIPNHALRWDLSSMTLGAFRVGLAQQLLDPDAWSEPSLLYYRDGFSTTVSVERWGKHLTLKNNGKVEASNGHDMTTQIMVAAYPLLWHSRGPQDLEVAVIGFGSGVTIGSALQFPIAHVDAIELEPSVMDAALTFFEDVSLLHRTHQAAPWAEHARMRIVQDDGRNFLASTDRRYDVIISEPSNPWITGVSDLFTREHFRISKRRLREGGVYCQWVQIYELSPGNIKTIYRTFAEQFEHTLVFGADGRSSDTILIGSDAPLPLDVARLERLFLQPGVRAELTRAEIESPHDLVARTLLGSRDEVMAYTQIEERRSASGWQVEWGSHNGEPCPSEHCRRRPAAINTDDNMRIEFSAPHDLIGYERYSGYLSTMYGEEWPWGRLPGVVRGLDPLRDSPRRAALQLSLLAHGRESEAAEFAPPAVGVLDVDGPGGRHEVSIPPARSDAPDSQGAPGMARRVVARWLSRTDEPGLGVRASAVVPAARGAEQTQFAARLAVLNAQLDLQDWEAALATTEGLGSAVVRRAGPALRAIRGFLLWTVKGSKKRFAREATAELEEALREDPGQGERHPELYFHLSRAQQRAARYGAALRNMRSYVSRTEHSPAGGPHARGRVIAPTP